MQSRHCDVAIIGTGTAGMGAYRAAKAHTDKVLLIEGGVYGTTCARIGCMPSKLMIAAANAAHAAQEADGFGVHVQGIRIDGAEVMQRVQRERDRFVGFVVDTVDGWPAADRIRSHAAFESPGVLRLADGTRIEAERVVIATGSRTFIPPPLAALAAERIDTNETVFEWPDLPESVAVFGAGVIALELGQALHRLGVRVRLFGRSHRLGGVTDPEVAEQARTILGAELSLALGSTVEEVVDAGEGFVVRWRDADDNAQEEHFARVLAATGRIPNIDGLALEQAGVPLNGEGLPDPDPATGRCGDSSLFLAGDVTGELPLLHEAADEGRIAGDNAGRYPDVQPQRRRAPLAVVFCEPQIAAVGQNFQALCQSGEAFAVGQVDFSGQGRARVMRENAGLLRVYAEHNTGRLLGAEMVGPRAEHLAHLLAWSVQAGLTIDDMLAMPFYHPVVEEGLRTALRDCAHALHCGPKPVPGCSECGPGD
ncbi:MAG: dihydrolipoyl dehydrogenase [Algiphilus sp.]